MTYNILFSVPIGYEDCLQNLGMSSLQRAKTINNGNKGIPLALYLFAVPWNLSFLYAERVGWDLGVNPLNKNNNHHLHCLGINHRNRYFTH